MKLSNGKYLTWLPPGAPSAKLGPMKTGAYPYKKESQKQAEACKLAVRAYPWWYDLCVPLLLVGLTLALYAPSLYYPFEFDDYANIIKYYNVRHNTLASLFLGRSRWISFWLNACYYSLLPEGAKYAPFLYRLGNVLFHACTGVLVFACVRLLALQATKSSFLQKYGFWLATLTSGLFLFHPIATQTVSYVIQGQLEGLAGLFIMLMLALFLTYTYTTGLKRKLALCALYVTAIIACGTKEIVMVAPVLMLLVDWFFISQGDGKLLKSRLWLHATLMVLMIGIYAYLLKPNYFLNIIGLRTELPNNIGNVLTQAVGEKITPYAFCLSQAKVVLHYLMIFIWPFAMSVDYDWKLAPGFFSQEVLVPLTLLALLGYWLYKRLRRNRTDVVTFCFLWFFIVLAPRSTIIPSTELLADYKTYAAGVGLLLLAAYGIIRFYAGRERLLLPVTAACCIALMGASYVRNQVWSSPEAFWYDIIQHAPGKARAYNNYGVALGERGEHTKAIEYHIKAIRLDRSYPDPYNNIAVCYAALKRYDEAIEALRRSIALMPYHPETYNNLATMLMNKHELEKVEPILMHALKLRPHYGKAYRNLGLYYMKTNQQEKALEAYKNACTRADFDNLEGFYTWATLSLQLKKYDDAITGYEHVMAIDDRIFQVCMNLAQLYRMKGRLADARALLQRTATWCDAHERVMVHKILALL